MPQNNFFTWKCNLSTGPFTKATKRTLCDVSGVCILHSGVLQNVALEIFKRKNSKFFGAVIKKLKILIQKETKNSPSIENDDLKPLVFVNFNAWLYQQLQCMAVSYAKTNLPHLKVFNIYLKLVWLIVNSRTKLTFL